MKQPTSEKISMNPVRLTVMIYVSFFLVCYYSKIPFMKKSNTLFLIPFGEGKESYKKTRAFLF